jgi:hypothetical protein
VFYSRSTDFNRRSSVPSPSTPLKLSATQCILPGVPPFRVGGNTLHRVTPITNHRKAVVVAAYGSFTPILHQHSLSPIYRDCWHGSWSELHPSDLLCDLTSGALRPKSRRHPRSFAGSSLRSLTKILDCCHLYGVRTVLSSDAAVVKPLLVIDLVSHYPTNNHCSGNRPSTKVGRYSCATRPYAWLTHSTFVLHVSQINLHV